MVKYFSLNDIHAGRAQDDDEEDEEFFSLDKINAGEVPAAPKPERPETGYTDVPGQLVDSAAPLARSIGGGLMSAIETFDLRNDPGNRLLMVNPENVNAPPPTVSPEVKRVIEEAQKDLQEAAPNTDSLGVKWAYDIGLGIMQMAPMLATAYATRSAGATQGVAEASGLLTMAGQVASQAHGEAIADGRSPEQARMDAGFAAVSETIPEIMPLHMLMKPGGKFLGRALKTAGLEALSEDMTELMQIGYDLGVLKENMTWGDAIKRLRDAGVVGAGMGGGIAVATEPFVDSKEKAFGRELNAQADRLHYTQEGVQEQAREAFNPVPGREFVTDTRSGMVQPGFVDSPRLTPEDHESPLADADIDRGKQIMEEATGELETNALLDKHGLPGIGGRVTLDLGDGNVRAGTLRGAFTQRNDELGLEDDGIQLDMDDGTTFEEFMGTLNRTGAKVRREVSQAAPPVEGPGGAAQGPVSSLPAQPPSPQPTAGASPAPTVETGAAPLPTLKQGEDGTRTAPVEVTKAPDLETARQAVQAAPTPAQKEAGNYAKGHVKVQGLDISIETAKGQERTSKPGDPNKWSVTMPVDYGYIKRTEGADGEQVDVYVGPSPSYGTVYVVDQYDVDTQSFDEHKAMIGFPTQKEAEAAYDAAFSDGKGPRRRVDVTPMSMDQFKAWLKSGKTKTPAAEAAPPTKAAPPTGPRVIINKVGKDGLTDAERKAKESAPKQNDQKTIAEVGTVAAMYPASFPNRTGMAQRIITAARTGTYDEIIAPHNKKSREIFEKITGKKLPNGVNATKAFFTGKPIPITEFDSNIPSTEEDAIRAGTLPVEDDRERQRRENVRKMQEKEKAAPAGATGAGRVGEPEGPVGPAGAEPQPAAPQKVPTKSADYGEKNTLVSKDRYEELRARLKRKLKDELRGGIDPEILAIGAEMAVFHLESGTRKFLDVANALASDMGTTVERLRKYLRGWYNGARDLMEDAGLDVSGMDTADEVRAALETIGKEADDGRNSSRPANEADDRAGDDGESAKPVREPAADGGPRDDSGATPEPGADSSLSDDGSEGLRPGAEPAGKPAGSVGGRRRRDKGVVGKRDGDGDGVSRGNRNYSAPDGSLKREGSWKATAARNLDIIELVKKLAAEGREATPEEQALLVKFTGWGASEIANGLFGKNVQTDPTTKERRLEAGWWTKPEWRDLVERAAGIFTAEELETALQSTQYAHYTSEGIIRGIWSGVERLGFKGGPILEPGMGTGLFAVAGPKTVMDASSYTGIELDRMTAAIAKHVLPDAAILNADFVKQKLPNGFFNLAIGNPPFSQTIITEDPAYQRYRFVLHDYFFAKTVDKVAPGGLMVFVTSKGTMDKVDPKARQYIADRADLLGAIRLPQTAFKENAGTEVVTDVLFFRKRAPGEAAGGEAWLDSLPLDVDGNTFNVNQYFQAHPEMVLGTHASTGSMYRANEYTVEPPKGDIEALFKKATEKLPKDVYAPKATIEQKRKETVERDFNPKAQKEGMLYLSDDGKVMRREEGSGVGLLELEKVSVKDLTWLRSYIGVRDAIKQAQYDQLTDGDWEASLAKLNKTYDAHVKAHGPILDFTSYERTSEGEDGEPVTTVYRRFKNERLWEMDVEGALVYALERITESNKIVKGGFLTGRTLKMPSRPQINSAGDALNVSLDERGRLDLAHVAQLWEKTVPETIEALGDLIYKTPGGDWQTADEYLSGDVLTKLDEAKVAEKSDPAFARNVDALTKVQPQPLTPQQITVKLGAGWVPTDVIETFADEVLGSPANITYEPATGLWDVEGSRSHSGRSSSAEWGTSRRSPLELLAAVLSNSSIKVTDTVDKKTVVNEAATAAANEKAKQMADRFKTWVWTDGKRAARLLDLYNTTYNNIAPRRFDGSHLSLPGLSLKYKLHPHQKRAIWRIVQTGNTYLGHAVGAGKTLEMIVSAMEQRRLGLVQKPLFVVPNHMLNQFAREFLDAYPSANIMVAGEKNFHTDNRRRFIAQAALNNPDAIIITHSSFGLLSTKEETRGTIVDEMIEELESVLNSLGSDQRVTRKKVEQQIEALKRRFATKASDTKKDQVVTFEDMGVDMLYVDEAHEFRKLDFATNMGNVKGIDPTGSMKALDLYIKTRYLEAQNPGRSLVMASGTPVTNTMAELYTIMKYMADGELRASGLRAFDSWASMFGEAVPNFEQNAAGKYEVVTRFAKFVNVPELMKRVRNFMDVLTSSQLGDLVPRPALKTGLPISVITPADPALQAYMKGELAQRIEISRKWKPSKDEPGNPDPLINIITDGRLSAIDLRFVGRGTDNPNSKLNQMVSKIIELHNQFNDIEFVDPATGKPMAKKGATQIVFSPVGFGEMVAESRGFDVRGEITRKLIAGGVKASEIAWMSDYKSHAKKETMFKEMRDGTKRILIGSPKNMGTGLNVQLRLKGLHFLSPPWYPADVEQPHGRILRQGNLNEEVEIYWYATKGTYDSTGWGMVARKARFIEQAMTGDDSVRVIEDISDANKYEMAAALAAGDERAIKVAGLQGDIERLTRLQSQHYSDQRDMQWRRGGEMREIAWAEDLIKKYTDAAAAVPDEPFSLTVGKQTYDKHKEAGTALLEDVAARFAKWTPASKDAKDTGKVGLFLGKLPILVEFSTIDLAGEDGKVRPTKVVSMAVEAGPAVEVVFAHDSMDELKARDGTALSRRIQSVIWDLPSNADNARRRLEEARRRVAEIDKRLGAPFEFEAELLEKTADLARLQAEMARDGDPVAEGMFEAMQVETWEGEGGAPAFDPFADLDPVEQASDTLERSVMEREPAPEPIDQTGPMGLSNEFMGNAQPDMFGGPVVRKRDMVLDERAEATIADLRARMLEEDPTTDDDDLMAEADRRVSWAAKAGIDNQNLALWMLVREKLGGDTVAQQREFENIAEDSSLQYSRITADPALSFLRWFGDSKVVDKNGAPLVVYHGTDVENLESFYPHTFFGDKAMAESYAKDRGYPGEGKVYSVYLSIQNPAYEDDVIAAAEAVGVYADDPAFMYLSPNYNSGDEHVKVIAELKRRGFDGAYVDDYSMDDPFSAKKSWTIFDPAQAKSTENRGSWDPEDVRMRYSWFGKKKEPAAPPVQATAEPDVQATVEPTVRPTGGKTVGVTADLRRIIDLFGPKMYQANMPDVTMKELLQNSFDGIKAAYAAGTLKEGTGEIDIYADSKTRTITMVDNGRGMSPETVEKAFLTLAGTDKGDLSEEDQSGGFGVAKMAFIFGNDGLELVTIKDGIKTTLKTTGRELLDGNAQLVTEKTDEPNGTTIAVKIPEKYTDDKGEEKTVYFSSYDGSYSVLKRPLIGDVSVRFFGKAPPTGLRKIARDIMEQVPFDTEREKAILNLGRQNDTPPRLTLARFDWGDIEIYMSKDTVDYPAHTVLSSGLYQFDTNITESLASWEKMPHNIVLNVRSRAKPTDANYPFTKTREEWNPKLKQDIGALIIYLQKIYNMRKAGDLGREFANLMRMEGSSFTDAKLGDLIPETNTSNIEVADVVDVRSGAVMIKGKEVSKDGEKVVTKANALKDNKIDAKKLDQNVAYFRSNLNVDLIAEAAKLGVSPTESRAFLSAVGGLILEFRNSLVQAGGYSGANRRHDLSMFSRAPLAEEKRLVGVSIDKDYHGVFTPLPFRGFFLNPLSAQHKNKEAVAEHYVATLIHEAVHEHISGHGEDFTISFHNLLGTLADGEGVTPRQLADKFIALLTKHKAAFEALRKVYNDESTKNVAKLGKGSRSANEPGSARGVPQFSRRVNGTAQSAAGGGGGRGNATGTQAGSGPQNPGLGPVVFDNAETQRRWKKAMGGVKTADSFIGSIKEGIATLQASFSRHYLHLPNTTRFADLREQLRKLEAAPTASTESIIRMLRSMTDGFTPADMELFTQKVVLDDLAWEVTQDHEIAFGMTPADVTRELAKVDAILAQRPEIADRVRQRKMMVRAISNRMVDAGVLTKQQIKNPSYYRHQVLEYAQAQAAFAKTSPGKLRAPKWAKRMGSKLDINANLLEAEFDWLQKALVNIAEARTIEWIKKSDHNIRPQLIADAKAHNTAAVNAALAADLQANGFMKGKRMTSPLNEEFRQFKQRIAWGFSELRAMLQDGTITVPPQHEDAADAIMNQDQDNVFPFLMWMIDTDQPGANMAAMIFKAISHRREWTKDLLGRNYADPTDMNDLIRRFAPEGYAVWAPDENNKMMFLAKTLPQHVIDQSIRKLGAIIGADPNAAIPAATMANVLGQAKDMLAVGGNRYQMVLPVEVAETLNNMRPVASQPMVQWLLERPMRAWKAWTLINPRRWAKYQLNNFSGDLDAVIAGNPKALRRMRQAISEIYDVMYRNKAPSARYREAVNRGVFDSGLTIQELPEINDHAAFAHLIQPKTKLGKVTDFPRGVWEFLKKSTQFRENWVRYAAYLDYADRLEAGESMTSIGYGAAKKEMVDGVVDPKDKAALLARELVGDYGAISHAGQLIRRRLIPFWSWLEINAKRYRRLTINAYDQGIGKGIATGTFLGVTLGVKTSAWLAVRAFTVYALITLYNHLFHDDDEEKLDGLAQNQLHVIIGNFDGEIVSIRLQGALSDALSWFGFEDAITALKEVEKGRASFWEVLAAIGKAPVNKVLGGITPVIMAPVELATGRKMWPDVWNPRVIPDRWRNLFQTFSLEHEYDLLLGKPSKGYGTSLRDTITYQRETGEIAYDTVRSLAYRWLEREKGQEGVLSISTPRSRALRDWRRALRYKDKDAAATALRTMRDLGMSRDDIEASLKRAHPLAPIAIKDRSAFLATLTAQERKQLSESIKWYEQTFLGGK